MVQDGRLGGAGRRAVVVTGDCVEQLGEDGRVEISRAFLDCSQPQMDVAEQSTLLRLAERGAATELPDASDVVQERGGEQEVGAEPGMELCGLAAERRHADRVLEQAARVTVVPVGAGSGEPA